MQTILQVEFSRSLVLIREEILTLLGCKVISVIGSENARNLDLGKNQLNVIVIGHGAPWDEREQLIKYFRRGSSGSVQSRLSSGCVTPLSAEQRSTSGPTIRRTGCG